MILGNTYHLSLRPGEELIRELGGLHRFTGWDGPILTDSGGFQLFSLAEMCKVTEERATFRSHLDGRKIELSPERAVAIQQALGSDVMMVLDHVIALPAEPHAIRDATLRTIRWARRCQVAQRTRTKRSSPSCKEVSTPSCVSGARGNSRRWSFPATPSAALASAKRRPICTG